MSRARSVPDASTVTPGKSVVPLSTVTVPAQTEPAKRHRIPEAGVRASAGALNLIRGNVQAVLLDGPVRADRALARVALSYAELM